jgi:RimJ/RimL family protein N-acetyltransferase
VEAILNLPKIGSNVIVRHLQTGDLSEMYRMESDPDVKRYLDGPVRHPREEWIRGVASKLSRRRDFAILAKDTGQFAGRAALDTFRDSEEVCEIQIVISKDFWGRLFGREVCKILIAAAFDELGAKQVVGVVHPENEKSLKLLRLFGFKKEGRGVNDLSRQIRLLKFVLSRSVYQKSPQGASMCDLPAD